MKMEVEFRSDMSRAETFRALKITLEAAHRLAHRMTPADLERLENFGAALIDAANGERRARACSVMLPPSAGRVEALS